MTVNRHSTVTHYQRPNMTHLQEGGTGEEVSEILFFSAKSKRRPSLIYSMQIIPVCLSIVARRKGVSATRRGGSNWTPISLLVGHPCKLFHTVTAPASIFCWSVERWILLAGRRLLWSHPRHGPSAARTIRGFSRAYLRPSFARPGPGSRLRIGPATLQRAPEYLIA